ncbi:MFS transporter [Pseudofrankia inefficax]|uniref:Major facilitator superfamily MFS_1 n=1 Tax=Pseudofrankia inefficax (strain DSM 45817 / CECT 9037 / DDB 130130 / EuI1c) TaxID=298654 RepID=E3J9S4_PSEI1|nr:MFS transporter [Pseudofrankia inefficax]ADP84577.1 major facilitator superfamily MFS_1 [Pseudofrankia inefficax]
MSDLTSTRIDLPARHVTVPGGLTRAGRGLALTAMIFAVAMTFIDQTIVAVAAPKIQTDLGLSSTGLQWAVNAYLLALAALFAFGGRLADTVGHRRMVVIGVVVFAAASALCGLTPSGPAAEGWLVAFRAVQGAGGALMYPAALAIVVGSYDVRTRGRALALFFGIAGGLTAVGPGFGGYLTAWTWRAIFWVNIPIALIALVLIAVARPENERRPAPMDYRGLVLIVSGVGLSVFGLQQSARWGWSSPSTWLCVALGLVLIAAFTRVELHADAPLINVRAFRDRVFLTDNAILTIAMTVFVPVFFFASEYAQISLDESPSQASLLLLYFFAGYVVAAQLGGRMLDRSGARRPVVIGCALACAGLALWGQRVTTLDVGQQVWCIVLAGAGMGLMLGQANTDALNHSPADAYGESTGLTQTVRNYGAALGLAVLGTILVTVLRSHLATSLTALGVPAGQAQREAASIAQQASSGGGGRHGSSIPAFVRTDFAAATQAVLYTMAGVMGFAGLVGLRGLARLSGTRRSRTGRRASPHNAELGEDSRASGA